MKLAFGESIGIMVSGTSEFHLRDLGRCFSVASLGSISGQNPQHLKFRGNHKRSLVIFLGP